MYNICTKQMDVDVKSVQLDLIVGFPIFILNVLQSVVFQFELRDSTGSS